MTQQADFLFEILTEELPPKALAKLEKAFTTQVIEGIKQAKLNFSDYQSFATPRRLAILINNLDREQPAQLVERKGPAVNVAYDDSGNPTQAALGFAKSCGVELSGVTTIKNDKGEWLFYRYEEAGKTIIELLPPIIEQALKQLPVPKMMSWGEGRYQFIRPVHNLVMLYGEQTIPCELFGCSTTVTTYGHRFHAPNPITITPEHYVNQLQEAYVLADYAERKARIRQQIFEAADQENSTAIIPEGLLDEVTSIVEWPVALVGHFDPRFLAVPKEALILSMETNQKYFPLTDNEGNLLPKFILISNIASKDPKQVLQGNEKVMRARLADAEFFYETDKKHTLASRVESLSQVIFQKTLGTLSDKTKRVTSLSEAIAGMLNTSASTAKRAAELSKTDLLTEMVGEFPELQGIMGRYYALNDGETKAVALALDEQYMPRFSGDELPQSSTGQTLALAERLDTLVGIFGINKIPTGEKDPFGLRRATLGILRIIIEKQLNLDLALLVSLANSFYGNRLTNPETQQQVLAFCQDRLKYWARQAGIHADVFEAVAAKQITKPFDFKQRLDAVNAFLKLPQADSLAKANKRVSNLLAKQQETKLSEQVDFNLLQEPAEINLADKLRLKAQQLENLTDYQQILTELAELSEPIDEFFDTVMVMVDQPKLRNNRLALLKQLRELFLQVADISLLQSS